MSERTAVQNSMLRYADAIGWGWLPARSKSSSRPFAPSTSMK